MPVLKDMLGRPLETGDIVCNAVGAAGSRAVGMTVARLVEVSVSKPNDQGWVAHEGWTVKAQPLVTGYKGHYYSSKPVTWKKTANLVKLEDWTPPSE